MPVRRVRPDLWRGVFAQRTGVHTGTKTLTPRWWLCGLRAFDWLVLETATRGDCFDWMTNFGSRQERHWSFRNRFVRVNDLQ